MEELAFHESKAMLIAYGDFTAETRFGARSGAGDFGAVMNGRRFRYLVDPLFLCCCALYALNRFWLKGHFSSTFLHGYFNDTLLIPCALPLMLWLQRQLGLRRDDATPRVSEVLFHFVIWSVLFEVIGPHIVRHATGDPWDVVAYVIGAGLALAWWHWTGSVRLAFVAWTQRAKTSAIER